MAKKSTVRLDLSQRKKLIVSFYKKTYSGLKAKDKLRMKKYNPATKKHEWFVEKSCPPQ